jgi:hypothetical protein
MQINPTRPLEELIGDNCGIVWLRVGNMHVCSPRREILRRCRPRNMRKVPVALRRGWAKCVLDAIVDAKSTYWAVTLGPKHQAIPWPATATEPKSA